MEVLAVVFGVLLLTFIRIVVLMEHCFLEDYCYNMFLVQQYLHFFWFSLITVCDTTTHMLTNLRVLFMLLLLL